MRSRSGRGLTNGRPGSAPGKARRGRPLDPAKHDRILEAATEVFLEHGFQRSSMDLVARRAGVSKITVYSHFTNKQTLFSEMINRLAKRLSSAIDQFALVDIPPEQALRRVARMYLDLALAPASLALHRAIVAEAARVPRLGRFIFRHGPTQIVGALANYFARQRTITVSDPHLAAEQFFGMVLGHTQLSLLLKARSRREVRANLDRIVDHAVQAFMHGALTPPQRRSSIRVQQQSDGRPLAQAAE